MMSTANLTKEFPSGDRPRIAAKPVYEYLPGFSGDITKCKKLEELPQAAIDYIRYIEREMGCPISYVSVGAERNEYIAL